MPRPVFRTSLVSQVADRLQEDLAAGRWRTWLPSERALVRELAVGRNTIRLALAELVRARTLRVATGRGYRIVTPPRRRRGKRGAGIVGLIVPQPLGNLRPGLVQWIDLLREQLAETGERLSLHVEPAGYRRAPDAVLRRLVERHPAACWVPVLSSEPMQRWLLEHGLPVVIAGSNYPEIDLPSVDLDYRAIGRHAAGVLFRRGHRRLGLLLKRSLSAGDRETTEGFIEAVRELGERATATVRPIEETRAGVARVLEAMLAETEPPTGLVVANPHCYLAAASHLPTRRRGAPVALISRDDDPFLNFVTPAPARYRFDPLAYARAIGTLVRHTLDGETPAPRTVRLMSELVPGESVCEAK
jgi:LacI family transcriptional regulator